MIAPGPIVLLTAFRFACIIVGSAIGRYVIKESPEIPREASNADVAAESRCESAQSSKLRRGA